MKEMTPDSNLNSKEEVKIKHSKHVGKYKDN